MFKTMPWALILGLMSSASSHAQSLDYQFHWGFLRLAELQITLETRPQPGDATERGIQFEGSTVGTLGKFLQYDGLASSHMGPNGIHYRMQGTDNGFDEHRELFFPVGQPPQVIDFIDDEVAAPTQAQLNEVGPAIDPLALMLQLMQAPLGSGCTGEFRVFDGKRLMQISASNQGMETIDADREWAWAGQALRCDMEITSFEMAAAVTNSESAEQKAAWLQGNRQTRSVWFAEIETPGADAQIVPVRFSIPGPIGRAKGRLVMPHAASM